MKTKECIPQKGVRYIDHTYALANDDSKEVFLKEREKHLGFSVLKGEHAFALSYPSQRF